MRNWPSPPRLGAIIRRAAAYLTESSSPMLDARVLAKYAFSLSDVDLVTNENKLIEGDALERFDALIERRARSEPIAFITGVSEFWSLELEMAPGVLAPRADSETLIEAIVARRDHYEPFRFLDLGCGSGALLCALLSAFPNATGLGVDINPRAAALSAKNLKRLRLDKRGSIAISRWNQALKARFDVIISNPPYIPVGDREGLPRDVRDYEDPRALYAGADGLTAYREIFNAAPGIVNDIGLIVIELGDGLADSVKSLASAAFPAASLAIERDLAGPPRALIIDLANVAK